jgi:glutamate decarboxylase
LTAQLLDKLMHDITDVIENSIKSVELVRKNIDQLSTNVTEENQELVYNMLLSISNDGDERLIKLKKGEANDKGTAKVVC